MYSVGVYEYLATLHVTTIYLTPYYDPTTILLPSSYLRNIVAKMSDTC